MLALPWYIAITPGISRCGKKFQVSAGVTKASLASLAQLHWAMSKLDAFLDELVKVSERFLFQFFLFYRCSKSWELFVFLGQFGVVPNSGVYFQFIFLLSGFGGLYPWILRHSHFKRISYLSFHWHPKLFWFWAEPWQKRPLLDLCLDSLENRSCLMPHQYSIWLVMTWIEIYWN